MIEIKIVNCLLHNKKMIFISSSFILLTFTTALADPRQIGSPPSFIAAQDDNILLAQDMDKIPHNSPKDFKVLVKEKYRQIFDLESDVKQTPNGPSGSLWIKGEIVPQKEAAIDLTKEFDRHARSRAVAKAFMDDEPALLGIIKPDEIQETKILTLQGYKGDYTSIYFNRYINKIELEDANLRIDIGPEENITGIDARLVPVAPEVYEATKKKMISEDKIRSIVEDDLTKDTKSGYTKLRKAELESHGEERIDIIRSFNKLAITTPPYVIWKVSYSHYVYKIDAFSGKILNKFNTIISPNVILKEPPK